MKKCNNCGHKEYSDTALFCDNCGNDLSNIKPTLEVRNNQTKKKTGKIKSKKKTMKKMVSVIADLANKWLRLQKERRTQQSVDFPKVLELKDKTKINVLKSKLKSNKNNGVVKNVVRFFLWLLMLISRRSKHWMDANENPTSLRIVAGVFVFFGVLAVIEVVVSWLHSQISLNITVLFLWIGPGLLRHNRTWRTWALAFLWFGLYALPIFCLLALFHLVFSGVPARQVAGMKLAIAIPVFVIILWQFWVLTRPDIRALFMRSSEPSSPVSSEADDISEMALK